MPSQQRNPAPQLLTFSDFSPGIVQRTNVVGAVANSPSPVGAASITNTYRCIALPGGGLGPMPKNTSTLSFTDLSTTALPAGVTAAATGFQIFGPMFKDANSPRFFPNITSTTPFELHLGYEYVTGGNQEQRWRKYPYYSGDNSVAINSETSTVTNIFGPTYFVNSAMNHPDPTVPGYSVVVGTWNQVRIPQEGDDYLLVYPDPTTNVTAVTDTPYDMGIAIGSLGPIIAHQNRIIVLGRAMAIHGANSGFSPHNELLFWTNPNDYTFVSATQSAFAYDVPGGYGAWGSLTSSDLLLIKHQGGAFLIQGDVNNPIIRRFPSVMGTHGVEVLGASTAVGYVYGVNNDGVYAWQGGDASVLLSPQLEDGFWQATNSTYLFEGQFASWGDLVLCPNNFVFDTKSNSWWRIEDTATRLYYCWQVDPWTNKAYGLRPTFSDTSPVYAGSYDSNTPASNFSWQSQPFSVFGRRRTLIRNIFLTAQGSGTVTITFTSNEGAGSVISSPNVPTLSTLGPTRVKLPCNILGSDFVMRVVSDGGVGAAPIIYTVDLEVEEASQLDGQ